MLRLALVATSLTVCAAVQWTKPGATEAEFNADRGACQYEAMEFAGGYDNSYQTGMVSGIDMALRRNEITTACLQLKGYSAAIHKFNSNHNNQKHSPLQ